MKYTVKINDKHYEVEISNLSARPIIAVVDGEPVEVWPESIGKEVTEGGKLQPERSTTSPIPVSTSVPTAVGVNPSVIRAPIPGNIVAVYVKPGDHVKVGQELCVLEAMKMRNTIRSGRSGTIAAVLVTTGLTVKHNDLLVEFTD